MTLARARARVIAALLLVTAASAVIAGLLVWRDRDDATERASDRTASISRLIVAHAEAAAAVADRIISVALPAVADWDLKDEGKAAAIAELLRKTVGENNVVASAAVIDAEGNVLVTSRTYPPKPLNIADRPFVKAYRAGAADPVIMGDPVPGPISGQKRFTFSRAVRNADGSLRAILTAAIQTANFDILYKEVANWPSAETGLYGLGGDVLVHVQTSSRATAPFLMALEKQITPSSRQAGTTIMRIGSGPELVSWSRSTEYPVLYSATSEPMSEVLGTWWSRTIVTVILVAVGNVLLWALSLAAIRMSHARQAAALHELTTREIYHRLKNSLQLISSLIRMRSAGLEDPRARETVNEILVDLKSVAEIHGMLQNLPPDGTIDLAQSIKLLCDHLQGTYRREIRIQTAGAVPVNAAHATGLAIIINELVTNAIKHGQGAVDVSCLVKNGTMMLQVKNDGSQLPPDFAIGASNGFGLRAVKAMVKGLNGDVVANNLNGGGVQFCISVPMADLARK